MLKKRVLAAFFTFALAFGMAFAMAGCASERTVIEDINADIPQDAPPLMPVSHQDRYDTLGVDGCYGCHGANADTTHMLAQAGEPPKDHYVDGDQSSYQIASVRKQCITCHSQG